MLQAICLIILIAPGACILVGGALMMRRPRNARTQYHGELLSLRQSR